MKTKQKLELTWIGKELRPKLEPRILLEDESKGHRVDGKGIFDNRLIFGDNLLALKALEQEFTGKVKCVYIDPPFNTGQAFPNYDDGLEHSIWLSLVRDRLAVIHGLLSDCGTLFVHIDDNELAYLTVLLDEIFGRSNRVSIVTFKQGSATGHKSINPGVASTSNFILVYAKNRPTWLPNRVFTAREDRDKRYGQFIDNFSASFSEWRFKTLASAFAESCGQPEKGAKKAMGDEYEPRIAEFVLRHARQVIRLARPDYEAVSAAARTVIDTSKANPSKVFLLERANHSAMYFIGGQRILFYSDKLKLIDGNFVAGEPLTSLWDDILSNNLHNEGSVEFPKGKKPEGLIKRCIDLSTNPGDLILDSFAGSGTTGAVAHKMGRRWIMIELGEHCHTHIIPRLKKVINNEDPGGVTEATNWKGGGGFKYFSLAPSLLEQDKWGNWVVNKKYDPEMLAEAMCKLEGFRYAPDTNTFWKHGQSTETDFLYVTTQNLSEAQLQHISNEVGDGQTLLICCAAFRAKADQFKNLTIKKIPQAVLSRCEWSKDDYGRNVNEMAPVVATEEPKQKKTKKPKAANLDLPLDAETKPGKSK
jgi:adenine-specific DNA-methyltransferase